MQRSTKHLERFTIQATDGTLGAITDFFFDDERWAIRYVVVDTGKWLPGRRVLISPLSVSHTDWQEQRLVLSIPKDVIANSPPIDEHKPVSRQHEIDYFNYFGYPHYWAQPGIWGVITQPILTVGEPPRRAFAGVDQERRASIAKGDGNLRSCKEVRGYGIETTDGEIGHVEDFLFSDSSWAIRYLAVDTNNWWPGKNVLVAPDWIEHVDWEKRRVAVSVTRSQLKNAPQYERAEHLDRQWEEAYYKSLQKEMYWLRKARGNRAPSAATED